MDGFLLAMLLVAALSLGGRDQWLVAEWSDRLGAGAALLVAAILTAGLSAGAMAWLGAQLAAVLPPRAGQMLVAFALAAAAAELAWPQRRAPLREPTRSLGALSIVLLARQVGDAARFTVFALAAWTTLPVTAGIGGALGGAAAAALGWGAGASRMARWPLRPIRLAMAALLGVAALFIGLNARFTA